MRQGASHVPEYKVITQEVKDKKKKGTTNPTKQSTSLFATSQTINKKEKIKLESFQKIISLIFCLQAGSTMQ